MKNEAAFWGALICSQVWVATGSNPLMALIWFVLAIAVAVLEFRRQRRHD